MFVVGVLRIGEAPGLGTMLLLCAVVSNAIGLALWLNRSRLRPYPALQGLLVTLGLATLVGIVYADLSGSIPLLDERLQNSPRSLYWILLIFPCLMLLFHRRFGPQFDPGARAHR